MKLRAFGCAVLLALVVITPNFAQQSAPARQPDVVYVPTPADVVNAMLKLANVTSADLVYDLGSGDGRIVITAAKMYGARGVGIDIDPERVREATANAQKAGVADKVTFRTEDLFLADISPATVVTLYLSGPVNARLAPKLMRSWRPALASCPTRSTSEAGSRSREPASVKGRSFSGSSLRLPIRGADSRLQTFGR
jgi:SAM-dependent methyltransferase